MVCNVRELIDDLVVDRPRLANAPLRAVISQVRFPRLLSLDDNDLSPLQRALARRYPLLSQERAFQMNVTSSPSPNAFFTPTGTEQRIYRFSDTEKTWTVTIGSETISLETSAYDGMHDFLLRWTEVIGAAAEALPLSAQLRLGLRYINEVAAPGRAVEQLQGWLRDELFTLVGAHGPRVAEPLHTFSQVLFRQPDGSLCNLRHGLAPNPEEETETIFLLDLDCYREESGEFDLEGQVRSLVEFNKAAFEIFDWAFPDSTKAEFGPKLPPRIKEETSSEPD
jgi:uncharacterized protein (TIGR04255 family)